MIKNLCRILAIVLCVSAGVDRAIGQNTNSGDIRGTVKDSTGAVIPDVTVTVLDKEKGVTKEFHTNSTGLYDTGPIVTGSYSVTFKKEGFAPFVRSNISLEVGTTTIDAIMKLGSIAQEVVVTTDVPLVQTESGAQSTVLEAREMQKRPNVGEDWENFVREIPGATGTASYTGATGQALSINGNLPYNAVLADGASSSLSHSGNADVAVFETVQELQVNTNAFSAQYGIGGAIFNQITKGGSNKWHGSLYEYAQNDALNARSYFQTTKPYLRYHNFGGSISGPILHDKLFFYFDYDQTINQSASTGFATVPTAAMRSGDFTGLAPIYDPTTASYATFGGKTYINRTQFAGNKLTTLDPAALKVQALIPLPNIAGSVSPTTGVTSNNYYYSVRGKSPFRRYFGRLDYDLTPKNRITASVTQHDNPAFYPNAFPCPINCYLGDVDGYNAQITDVWNISNRMVNEARLGYTNQLNFFTPQTEGSGLGPSLGIPSLKADILPTVNISSYTGVSPGTAAVYKEHDYDPSDVVTMIRGRHVLHFGGEYLIFQDNSTAWGNVNAGTYGFTGVYTQCTYCVAAGQTTSSGNGYADFLLGQVQNQSYNITPEFAGRQKAPQMFIQDDWKVKSNLTVNIGLRYQIMEGWSDNKGNQRTFDPLVINSATNTPGAIWFAINKDHGRTQLQNNVYTTFLPRFGFAWEYRPGSVLRGGYGLYAYLWSLDTYGGDEGNAFGYKGSISDTTNGFTPLGALSTANNFPYIGASTSNSAYNGQSVGYTDQNTPTAEIHQYNLTLEQQLGANMSASIAYVGSRSVNLIFNRDINQVPVSKLSVSDQSARPYPQYLAITGSTYNADANYNSLQLQLHRRLSHSLAFEASYVWSKFLDEYDSSAWGSRNGTTTYQNSYDIGTNYGPSNFDVRHAFKGYASYTLPFGHGQPLFNKNDIVDEVIGGWLLSSNFALQTGNPFTVTVPSNLAQSYAQSGNLYPNWLADPNKPSGRTIKSWFNTGYVSQSGVASGSSPAFSIPANGTFGNEHRNNIYGPGLVVFDASLGKTFNLYKDRYRLQVRADANNVLNHPSFGLPNSSLSNGSVGQITSTTIGGRAIQLGARFSF